MKSLPRTSAVLLALLMAAPAFPVTAADPASIIPPPPELGRVRPGDQCLSLAITGDVLAAATAIAGGQTNYFAYDRDVPGLCGPSGQIEQWRGLIEAANAIRDNYTLVAHELQRQADSRLDATYPDGACPRGDNLSGSAPQTNGVTCGATRPQVTLLNDHFDNQRIGGFGNWSVVTHGAEAPVFRTAQNYDRNGSYTSWSFGDSTGYARGVHQWLVSPEIDLTAVRANIETAVLAAKLQAAKDLARSQIAGLCTTDTLLPTLARLHNPAYDLCGPGASPNDQFTGPYSEDLKMIFRAFDDAIVADTKSLPLSNEIATLEFAYASNLANGTDGVRPWLWVGDHQPTRADLYPVNLATSDFGSSTESACVLGNFEGQVPAAGLKNQDCTSSNGLPGLGSPAGGIAVNNNADILHPCEPGVLSCSGSDNTYTYETYAARAFKDATQVARSDDPLAFTGDQKDFRIAHVDLTPYSGKRVWLMLEVSTLPDEGRGGTFFDASNFPTRVDRFGFDLKWADARGDSWIRNLRLKDVGSNMPSVQKNDPWSDGPNVHAVVPPGTQPIDVRVHNAGNYLENATLTLDIRETSYANQTQLGASRPFGTASVRVLSMKPSEVRDVRIPWPTGINENALYWINATLTPDALQTQGALTDPVNLSDPNRLPARPPNYAGSNPQDPNNVVDGSVIARAFTSHRLTPARVSPGDGAVVEVCASVSAAGCEPLYTAPKGTQRIILTGIRNDGVMPENIQAVLDLKLEGLDRSAAILDGAVKTLTDVQPGETRVVSWTLAPPDQGVYTATLAFQLPSAPGFLGPSVQRLVYVQRGTGLICYDNLLDDRECGPSFSASAPSLLEGVDLTAAVIDSQGGLYATGAILGASGGLYYRSRAGEWTQLADLTNETLAGQFGRLPREDIGYGNVSALAFGPDGTLYFVGTNGTAFARASDGTLHAIPFAPLTGSELHAFAPLEADGTAGTRIPITGGSQGGVGTVAYEWSIQSTSAPDIAGAFDDKTNPTTNFTPAAEGVTYTLQLNATDELGATSVAFTTVRSTLRIAACAADEGVLARDAIETFGAHGPATDLQCIRESTTASPAAQAASSGNLVISLDLAGPARTGEKAYYSVDLATQDSAFAYHFDVTYDPAAATRVTVVGRGNGTTTSSAPAPTGTGAINGRTITLTIPRQSVLMVSDTDGKKNDLRVTASDALGHAADDSMHGTWSDGNDATAPTLVGAPTASVDPVSGQSIVLTWGASSDASGVSYDIQRANFPEGPWAYADSTSATTYTDTGVADGRNYTYRIVAKDGAGNRAAASTATNGASREPFPVFSSAAWHNGTLYAGGLNGLVWRLNQTSGKLESERLMDSENVPYNGNVNALLPVGDRLYAAGDFGRIFVEEGSGWNATTHPADETRDLLTLAVHEGVVYAAGRDKELLRSIDADHFVYALAPDLGTQRPTFVASFVSNQGTLFLLTADGMPVSCTSCSTEQPLWSFPVVPIPTLVIRSVVVRAHLAAAASAAGVTVIVGQGGVVLDYQDITKANDTGDWSTVPDLLAHDNGSFMTSGTAGAGDPPATIDLFPPTATSPASAWTQMRVTLHHHVAYATTRENASVRLFFLPYPSVHDNTIKTAEPQCGHDRGVGQTPTTYYLVCNQSAIMVEHSFVQNSTTDAWDTDSWIVTPPRANANVPDPTLPPLFSYAEFVADPGAHWAVDDARVEQNIGTPSAPQWITVAAWYGTDSPKNVGNLTWLTYNASQGNSVLIGTQTQTTTSLWTVTLNPFGLDITSAWHLTTRLASRPVWALNDEVLGDPAKGQGGTNARLQDGWNMRLVTPAIDLGDAYDPVLTFKQEYSFRINYNVAGASIQWGDAGLIEVQYLMHGQDCGVDDDSITCWSSFMKLKPMRYSDTGAEIATDYPLPSELGLGGIDRGSSSSVIQDAWKTQLGPDGGNPANNDRASNSWWGRTREMVPTADHLVVGARDVDKYGTVVVPLTGLNPNTGERQQPFVNDTDGVSPLNLSGKIVRFAFHGLTAPPSFYDSHSFPGEGWYVADVKVKGARQLGIDLASTNLTLNVGYDANAIGVGPGTRVPVNVTVENHGLFDVTGYNVDLEVRKVTDATNGRSERVALYTLAQQPLLKANKGAESSRNHTFAWDVPAGEEEQYFLTVTTRPLGIDRDEDPTDNVALLGTLHTPLVATSHPEFHVELQVTPENATTEITRFVAAYVVNTGNVPLTGVTVTREVHLLGGDGSLQESRTWVAQRPAPAGARVSLQSISDDVNPATDLFWHAPRSTDYRFTTTADAYFGALALNDSRDKIIHAFATYFFDDAETGPRGESVHGDWAFDSGWNTTSPGFLNSADAYGFGDLTLNRYPNDADSSAALPVVDISGARSARIGFYTKYDLERGFDAVGLEARPVGGSDWTLLTPENVTLPDGRRITGYNETPLAAASALHTTHDPSNSTYAFTGSSALAPDVAPGGWIYRQFDLTDYASVREDKVPYYQFGNAELVRYLGIGMNDLPGVPVHHGIHPDDPQPPYSYVDTSWHTGDVADYQYWEVLNDTQDPATMVSPTGASSFWWSGSPSLYDDGLRPRSNNLLVIPIDQALAQAADDDVVVVDWWEYQNRYREAPQQDYGEPSGAFSHTFMGDANLTGIFRWYDAVAPTENFRINVTTPTIIGHQGKWLHLQSDMTMFTPARRNGLPSPHDIEFGYFPVAYEQNSSRIPSSTPKDSDALFLPRYTEDPGLAVDAFHISAYKLVNGKPTSERMLLDTQTAWDHSTTMVCNWSTNRDWVNATTDIGTTSAIPCAGYEAVVSAAPTTGYRPWQDKITYARIWTGSQGHFIPGSVTAVDNPYVHANVNVTMLPADSPADLGIQRPGDDSTVWYNQTITEFFDNVTDFAANNVTVGDVLYAYDPMHGMQTAPIVSVDAAAHKLELGTPITLASNYSWAQLKWWNYTTYQVTFRPPTGIGWNLTTQIPSVPGSWHVEGDIMDENRNGGAAQIPTPTGELPQAWYTGTACLDDPAFGGTGQLVLRNTVAWTAQQDRMYPTLQRASTATTFAALGYHVGDYVFFRTTTSPPAGTSPDMFYAHPRIVNISGSAGATSIDIEPIPNVALIPANIDFVIASGADQCLHPLADTRLVTPSMDLGKIAGSTAELSFTTRYDFADALFQSAEHPLSGGGVVEISTFDPQNGWTPWHQIYANENAMTRPCPPPGDARLQCPVLGSTNSKNKALAGAVRGGYSAYTVAQTYSANGYMRNDPPFETIPNPGGEPVSYLYSGNSQDISGGATSPGWVTAHFEVSKYIGSKVRFAFHVAMSGAQRSNQLDPGMSNPDQDPTTPTLKATGWWVKDIAITGRVLHGRPLELRLRAATDSNVQDGSFVVDDAALFGSRYASNVGIFVNETLGAYGAIANNSTLVPITLTNLGATVRRDLAVEIKPLSDVKVQLSDGAGPNCGSSASSAAACGGAAPRSVTIPGKNGNPATLRLYGYNLAPGQSATVWLNVAVPSQVSLAQGSLFREVPLYAKVLECTAGVRSESEQGEVCGDVVGDQFAAITDNEIQGFLTRTIRFEAVERPDVTLLPITTTPAAPLPGQPVTLTMPVRLTGYSSVTIDTTCTAMMVDTHTLQQHDRDPTEHLQGATFPCQLVDGENTFVVDGTRTVELQYRATPPAKGFASFVVNGTFRAGDGDANQMNSSSGSALVGTSPVLFNDDFSPSNLDRTRAPFNEAPHLTDLCANWTTNPPACTSVSQGVIHAFPTGHTEAGSIIMGVKDSTQTYGSACPNGCTAYTPALDLHNYSSEDVAFSFWHMPQFAKYDGGQIVAKILLSEGDPVPGVWSDDCILTPRGGYDTQIQSYLSKSTGTTTDPIPTDTNNYPHYIGNGNVAWPPNFADTARLGFYGGLASEWKVSTIDLNEQTCYWDAAHTQPTTLLGHTIKIGFAAYEGQPMVPGGIIQRGPGRGWLIDDVHLSTQTMDLRPARQPGDGKPAILLLDNATKPFNVLVTNKASYPDKVHFTYDEGNSSAPPGSVQPPADVDLAPGETRIVQVNVTLPRDPSLLPTTFRARLFAASLLDPLVQRATDFEFAFAPRQWAELVATASVPTSIVQEGTETFVPIQIENLGLVDSVDTQVQILDSWNGGSQTTTIDLHPIPSAFQHADDATRVLPFAWRPVRGSVGLHTLTITVDPQRLGEEYTRDNNLIVLRVPVSELLVPDVDISASDALLIRDSVGALVTGSKDADVTRYEITAGELATLQVVVKNTGRAGATNVDVRAFIGSLSLPPKTVSYIAPGGEVTLSFNWLAQKGEYPIEIVARTEGIEISTANDRNPAQGVTILIVKGYDVAVTLAQIGNIVDPESDLKVPFDIANSGNAGEDLVLVAKAPAGWNVTLPRAAFFLRAGETYSGIALVHVPDDAVAGEQFISLSAVARENPMKAAAASTPAHVRPSYGGSVAETHVTDAPPLVAIPISLTNEGNSLEPWSVSLRLPPGWSVDETMPTKVIVPPHASTLFVFHARVPLTTAPGDRQLVAKAVMPDGEERTGIVHVDIAEFHAASAKIVSDKPRESRGTLVYDLTIENAGNVQQPFAMVLQPNGTGLNAKVEPQTFTLPPGGKTIATLTISPSANAEAGAYTIPAYTMFAGVLPNSAEGRANAQTLQLTVVRPDLRTSSVDYLPHADVRAGDKIVVKVPVTNRGQGATRDLPVDLYADDVFIGETILANVASGETREATLNWTATQGQHTLTVVVDPYKDTVDADRADNAASTLVQVKAASVASIVGGSKVPMPPLALSFIIALGVAIALAPQAGRRWRLK